MVFYDPFVMLNLKRGKLASPLILDQLYSWQHAIDLSLSQTLNFDLRHNKTSLAPDKVSCYLRKWWVSELFPCVNELAVVCRVSMCLFWLTHSLCFWLPTFGQSFVFCQGNSRRPWVCLIELTSFWLLLKVVVIYSRDLDLKKPMYQRTAAYGHFGRDAFPWEVPKKLKY